MDTLMRPEKPEDDTREEMVIRQIAEIPPIDLIHLELILAQVKSGKTPGPKNIEPELIKNDWTYLRPQLVYLFNVCFRHGLSPRTSQLWNISTLFSSASPDLVTSSIPISQSVSRYKMVVILLGSSYGVSFQRCDLHTLLEVPLTCNQTMA